MEYTTVPRYSLNMYSFSWTKSFFGQPHFYFLYTAPYYLIHFGVRAAWVRTGARWTLIVIFSAALIVIVNTGSDFSCFAIFPVLRSPPEVTQGAVGIANYKTKATNLDASKDFVKVSGAEQFELERSLLWSRKQRLVMRQNNETMLARHTPHSTPGLKRLNSPNCLIKSVKTL